MKKILLALVLAVLAFLAWRVLGLGMADHYARSDPERALAWRSDHPEALLKSALRHVVAKDWPAAKAAAERALKVRPIDGRPLRVLAQVAEQDGDKARALMLYRQAAKLAPRDLPTRAWLLQHALERRDAQEAATQMDALLRLQPELLEQLQPQANLLAVTPAARGALLNTLAAAPPWRAAFLAGLARAAYPVDAIAPFFAALKHTPDTPMTEIDPWIARLRNENRALQAYVTWVNRIPESQRQALGNVFDGGFEIAQEEQPGAFAWQTPALAGATAYWSANRGTVGENSYVVEFEGRRTPFAHLNQALVLPPGDWQLSWRAKGVRVDSPRGLIWQLQCDVTGNVLAESAPMMGHFEWREQTLAFSVPPGCEGQQLVLRIPARIPAETVINGTLWLDAVAITPVIQNSLNLE
jgi:tetratricopeptide (TPR) repeat protein